MSRSRASRGLLNTSLARSRMIARVFLRAHQKNLSCEKNVFDGFLKSLFLISTLYAEECAVAASAPI